MIMAVVDNTMITHINLTKDRKLTTVFPRVSEGENGEEMGGEQGKGKGNVKGKKSMNEIWDGRNPVADSLIDVIQTDHE